MLQAKEEGKRGRQAGLNRPEEGAANGLGSCGVALGLVGGLQRASAGHIVSVEQRKPTTKIIENMRQRAKTASPITICVNIILICLQDFIPSFI
jgi:hypothetical protein